MEENFLHSGNCLNCNTPYTKNNFHCSVCGQRTSTHRFSLKSILAHDFIHAIFHLDRGFFSTLIKLFTQPGVVVKEFLDGKRVKYFNYFTMIVILITVGHFFQKYSPIKLTDLMSSNTYNNKTIKTQFKVDTALLIGKNVVLDSQKLFILNQKIDSLKQKRAKRIILEREITLEQEKIFQGFERFTKENPKLFYLILIPIYTFFTFIWFYKSRLNFSEHIITNIYKTCGDIIIGVLLTIGFYIYPKLSFWIIVYPFFTLISIVYSTWFYQNFFKRYYKDAGIVFLKSLASVISVHLFLGIVGAAYMLVAGFKLGLKQNSIKQLQQNHSIQKKSTNSLK